MYMLNVLGTEFQIYVKKGMSFWICMVYLLLRCVLSISKARYYLYLDL